MTIVDGTGYVVSSGQTDVGDVIENGGSINVQSGGVTNSTTILNGNEVVNPGGAANDTIISNGGSLQLFGGASANAITLNSGGRLAVASGYTLINFVVSAGSLTPWAGGITVDAVISSGGVEFAQSGGTANGTVINDGGSLQLFGGASANAITLNSGGGLVINSGYTLQDFILSGGATAGVASGGIANGTVVSSGAIEDVASGGTANGTVINDGGSLQLFGGASANAITLNSGGGLVINSGYTLKEFILSGGATVGVASGGIANGTVVSSGAIEDVASGGTANDTVINDRGSLLLFAGATDLGATVNDGGTLLVQSGGIDSGTAVENGGALIVLSGGSALLGNLSDGGTVTINGGTLEIGTGAQASGDIEFSQNSEGTLQIDDTTMPTATISGFLRADTIDLAGVNFSSGGTADLQSNNELHVSIGGNLYLLQLDPSANYSGEKFQVTSDGNGGSEIRIATGPNTGNLVVTLDGGGSWSPANASGEQSYTGNVTIAYSGGENVLSVKDATVTVNPTSHKIQFSAGAVATSLLGNAFTVKGPFEINDDTGQTESLPAIFQYNFLNMLVGTLTQDSLSINSNGQELDVHGLFSDNFKVLGGQAAMTVNFTQPDSYVALVDPRTEGTFNGPLNVGGPSLLSLGTYWSLAQLQPNLDLVTGKLTFDGELKIPLLGEFKAGVTFTTQPLALDGINVNLPVMSATYLSGLLNLSSISGGVSGLIIRFDSAPDIYRQSRLESR